MVNRIAAGDISDDGKKFLNASRGVGIPKDDTGDLRPIAVGHIFLRLIGSMALSKLSKDVKKHFLPVQFGVGIQNGCELMINAIKARLKLNPDDICISCDVKNAFNSFDRGKLWQPLREHFPSLEAFVRLAYMEEGTVTFTEPGDITPSRITSSVGSRQGCSLGSFLYALAIQSELLALQKRFPMLLIVAYCDDLYITGPPSEAIKAYHSWAFVYNIKIQGELRDDKGKVYARSQSEAYLRKAGLPSKMKFSNQGLKVLGAPIGNADFTFSFIEEKVKEIEADMDLIGRMPLHQAQHILTIRSVQQRMNYIFRCVPSGDLSFWRALMCRYDNALMTVPQRICHHTTLSARAVSIAHLPQDLGGLGYKSWIDSADPAYLASYSYAAKIVPSLFPALKLAFPEARYAACDDDQPSDIFDLGWSAGAAFLRLQNISPAVHDKPNVDDRPLRHIQRDLSKIVDDARAHWVTADLRKGRTFSRDRQHLAFHLSAREDIFTFNTTPTDEDTTLKNVHLQLAMSLRLLEPIIPLSSSSTMPLRCPLCKPSDPLSAPPKVGDVNDIDEFGYHSYRCTKDGHAPRTKYQHDKLVLIWERVLRHAGFQILHEPRGYLVLSGKRPDIIIEDKQCIFLDVRTCDPCLQSQVDNSITSPGSAADRGTNDKERAWLELVEAQGDSFMALCHESPGLIGDSGLGLLDRAAARYSSSNKQRSAFKAYWLMRLHITHTRGVAETLRHRFPFHDDSHLSHFDSGSFLVHRSPFPETLDLPCERPGVSRTPLRLHETGFSDTPSALPSVHV